ncbi:DUF488 domain-containing protein [Aequorivita antarctica]|uniref:DUF488 domain-containing protein n=1 Tax=Aequorivita antarctica TaxID=153266 RepID=UPI000DBBF315|nr:hypothetical protein AEQU3_01398 [Aequorivita antarctica]
MGGISDSEFSILKSYGNPNKRIYEEALKNDGFRVLVDRVWPRGVSKEDTKLDEWVKEIAPSTELRKWFDHKEERFDEFSKKI